MKLDELTSEGNWSSHGTYAGVRFDDASVDCLLQYIKGELPPF